MISKICCSTNIVRLLGIALFAFSATVASTVSVASAQDKVDFVKEIKPIIEKHCISCHGPEEEEAFRIDERESALEYIEPTSEDSDFYQVLVSDDEEELMPPPEDGIPLTEVQIELVKNWIDQGADWPEDVVLVDTSPQDEPENEAPAPNGHDAELITAQEKTQQIFNAIGSLHPAAVHLPIGLLLASGLFALLSLRGNFVMSDCAYYCLWLGTLGAIVACLSGWWFSPMEHRGDVTALADLLDQEQPVFWHRTGGLIVTVFAFLLALFAAGARSRDPDDGIVWKLGLIVLACGIGWVGHTGGDLHYGDKHYQDLNIIYERIIGTGPGGIAPPKAVEPADENAEVGKVSDEQDPEKSSSRRTE
jgi:uncharacterized membrane protein